MKRTFDLCLSVIGLVLASPVLLLVAALVRWCDGGPVLFRQVRVGRGFRPFHLLKFRTMARDAESCDAPSGDAEITRLGAFLRRTKLDELPQLWNVVRGEMSLVGPRPELPRYVELFRDDYRAILAVRPGVTDPASILYRDEAALLAGSADPESVYVRSILPHKLRLARRYVMRASLGYDVWLLAVTAACLLSPQHLLDRRFAPAGRFHHGLTVAGQALLVVLAHLAAVGVRFEGGIPAGEARLLGGSLLLLVLFRAVGLEAFGLNVRPWRYFDARDLRRLAGAVLASSVAFWFVITAVLQNAHYSRSVLLLDAIFTTLVLAGGRLLARMQHGLVEDYRNAQRALLVGSGDAVDRALARIATGRTRALEVSGIVDADPGRAGLTVRGVPVLGGPGDLERLLADHDPDLVLIASGSIASETRRLVTLAAARYEKPCTTVEAFERRVAGERRFSTSDLEAEALLPREPMVADLEGLSSRYAGRRVLVTGAGGAVGSELARTLASLDLERLVLVDRHEPSLEAIEREIRLASSTLPVQAALGDVTDREWIEALIGATRPHVILHAAASTRASLVASHPEAAFHTNVEGARTVAEAALAHGVARFLLVSSDEAVEPRGVLARSRRAAEAAVCELAGRSDTLFAVVRFPLALDDPRGALSRFRAEIERGGPVRVEGAESMVLPVLRSESAHLILEAADCASGGDVILIDCGRPQRLLDLARSVVLESGLVPGRDVDIVCSDLAPDAATSPRLCTGADTVWRTSHSHLLRVSFDRDVRGEDASPDRWIGRPATVAEAGV